MRVLNCSATGCLIVTTHPVPVNTVATLQVSLGGRALENSLVVRCQAISEDSKIYHVATRFLSVSAPSAGSLRPLLRGQTSGLTGWLSNPETK